VRRTVSRVAWHGTRPVVSEATRAWTGGIDAQDLTDDEIVGARENVLVLMTPRAFDEAERNFVLGPSVTASVIDAAVRALLTRDAQRIAEVAAGFAPGAVLGTPTLSVIDDPTVRDTYGSYAFDDRGERATARPLIDHGSIAGRIEHERRPGHVGLAETLPSNLRVLPGNADADNMLDEGVLLEEPVDTLVDPASGRIVIQIARAREWQGGRRTGRMFADVEVIGDTRTLLASIADASRQTRAIGIRDELDGQPRWRSIDAPWLRGRGIVRQRRRPT
jgi:predicted Zn-dependent protease